MTEGVGLTGVGQHVSTSHPFLPAVSITVTVVGTASLCPLYRQQGALHHSPPPPLNLNPPPNKHLPARGIIGLMEDVVPSLMGQNATLTPSTGAAQNTATVVAHRSTAIVTPALTTALSTSLTGARFGQTDAVERSSHWGMDPLLSVMGAPRTIAAARTVTVDLALHIVSALVVSTIEVGRLKRFSWLKGELELTEDVGLSSPLKMENPQNVMDPAFTLAAQSGDTVDLDLNIARVTPA